MYGKPKWFKRKKPVDEEERVQNGDNEAASNANSGNYGYTPVSTSSFETCSPNPEDTNREGKFTKAIGISPEHHNGFPLELLKWQSPAFRKALKIHDPYESSGLFLEHFDEPETALVLASPGSGTIQGSDKGVVSSLQGLHEELITDPPLLPSEITPLLQVELPQTLIDTLLWVFWEYLLPPRARAYFTTHWGVSAILAVSILFLVVYLLHRSGNSRLASVIVLSVMCGLEMLFWGRDELRVCSGQVRER